MITDLAFAIVFFIIFNVVGSLFASAFASQKRLQFEMIIILLLGVALVAWCLALSLYANTLLLPIIAVVFLILIFNLRGEKRDFIALVRRTFQEIYSDKTLFLFSLFSAFLINPHLLDSGIRRRVGPDPISWIVTAKHLCSENRIDLAKRVNAENFPKTWQDLVNSKEVFSVNSFTDQINIEWILGANRQTVQKLISMNCLQESVEKLQHSYNGLLILSMFATFTMIRLALRETEISRFYKIVIPITAVLAPSSLMVVFESGIGQVLAVPFFSAAVLLLNQNISFEKGKNTSLFLILACSFSFCFTADRDLSIPLLIFTAMRFKFSFLRKIDRTSCLTFVAFVILHTPFMPLLLSELTQRVNSLDDEFNLVNGWHLGGLPTLIDIVGIRNWLPQTGLNSGENDLNLTFFLCALLSILLSIILIKIELKRYLSGLILVSTIGYYSAYFNTWPYFNNFIILKISAFICPTFSTLVITGLKNSPRSNFQKKKSKLIKIHASPLVVSFIIFSCVASIDWTKDFAINSQYNHVAEKIALERVMSKYDLEAMNLNNVDFVSLNLFGNFHYGAKVRAYDIEVRRRDGVPMAIVTNNEDCSRERDIDKKIIYQDHSYCVWQPIAKVNSN